VESRVESSQLSRLQEEIRMLKDTVAQLSQRLAEQAAQLKQPATVSAPLATAERVEGANAQVPPASSRATTEVELRNAQRALARIIERLDMTPDAKRQLLQGLRPARALDAENPWVATN
jgi:cell division septum initiation protein DivIVA